MNELDGKRVAMLAADGFEQSELIVPKRRLEEAGAKVDIVSLKTGEIWGWNTTIGAIRFLSTAPSISPGR